MDQAKLGASVSRLVDLPICSVALQHSKRCRVVGGEDSCCGGPEGAFDIIADDAMRTPQLPRRSLSAHLVPRQPPVIDVWRVCLYVCLAVLFRVQAPALLVIKVVCTMGHLK